MLGAATITVMMLMVVCVVVLLISAVDSHCVRDMSQFNFVSRTKRLGNCRLQESENGVPAGRWEVVYYDKQFRFYEDFIKYSLIICVNYVMTQFRWKVGQIFIRVPTWGRTITLMRGTFCNKIWNIFRSIP